MRAAGLSGSDMSVLAALAAALAPIAALSPGQAQ